MMVSGGNRMGILAAVKQIAIKAVNSGKRVAYFEMTDHLEDGKALPEDELKTTGLLKVFRVMKIRVDDVEIYNGFSLDTIVRELNEKEETDEKYDLLVITDADFLPELESLGSPGEMAERLKNALKRFRIPLVFSMILAKDSFRRYNYLHDRTRLFFSVRNFVDYLLQVDGDNDGYHGEISSQIDFRFHDCRKKEIEVSCFFNKYDSRLYLKDESTTNLYNRALALGLDKDDAIAYASYWNRNKKESAGYKNDNN